MGTKAQRGGANKTGAVTQVAPVGSWSLIPLGTLGASIEYSDTLISSEISYTRRVVVEGCFWG